MGNETSLPEADGLQPPSQIPPHGAAESEGGSLRTGGKKAVKLAKAVLSKATDGNNFRGDHGDISTGSYPQQTGSEKFYPAQEQYSPKPPPQQYYNGQKSSAQGDAHVREPIMFASEGGGGARPPPPPHNSNAAQHAASSIRTGGKAVRNGGRALINSMRSLTVATGTGKNGGTTAPRSGGLKKEENEWETNWDEDGDDSSSEEDEDVSTPAAAAIPHIQPKPQPIARPPNVQALRQSATPALPTLAMSGGSNLLGFENNSLSVRPKVPMYEKPNVQMFLPLLRVLGKGSFGKVRYYF